MFNTIPTILTVTLADMRRSESSVKIQLEKVIAGATGARFRKLEAALGFGAAALVAGLFLSNFPVVRFCTAGVLSGAAFASFYASRKARTPEQLLAAVHAHLEKDKEAFVVEVVSARGFFKQEEINSRRCHSVFASSLRGEYIDYLNTKGLATEKDYVDQSKVTPDDNNDLPIATAVATETIDIKLPWKDQGARATLVDNGIKLSKKQLTVPTIAVASAATSPVPGGADAGDEKKGGSSQPKDPATPVTEV
jgi:hypothetical protein